MNLRAESSINHDNEAQDLVTGPDMSTRPENRKFRNNTWKWNLLGALSMLQNPESCHGGSQWRDRFTL